MAASEDACPSTTRLRKGERTLHISVTTYNNFTSSAPRRKSPGQCQTLKTNRGRDFEGKSLSCRLHLEDLLSARS